jgi:hypothetical protein
MDLLTSAEREFLLLAYGGGARTVSVLRLAGPTEARLTAGRRQLSGGSRLRALASLYSRGIVAQIALNRFSLTPAGKALIRLLRAGGSVERAA